MDKKIYVIAGTQSEFNEYRDRRIQEIIADGFTAISMSHFVSVNNPDQLRGLSNPHGVLYGTWQLHPNIKEILNQLILTMDVDSESRKRLSDILVKMQEEKLHISLNGVTLIENRDYTIHNNLLTFSQPPSSSDVLVVTDLAKMTTKNYVLTGHVKSIGL